MGDRGQIVIKQQAGEVWFYTHWRGADIPHILAQALKRGAPRWDDEEYLARIIFDDMMGQDYSLTGFGVGLAQHGDNEHPLAVVKPEERVVLFQTQAREPLDAYQFGQLIELDQKTLDRLGNRGRNGEDYGDGE